MLKLSKSFRSMKPFKALVLGDFFIDTYTTGFVKRISPEAPVQVLEVINQESKPGGAGNAAKNMKAMGAQVFVMGRVGDDLEGEHLKNELLKEGIQTSGLIKEPHYKTPIKNRLIAGGQQLLRVDLETIAPLHSALEPLIIKELENLIAKVQIVAISDYGKGFLTPFILTHAIQIAKQKNIPLIVDPKGTNFRKYQQATILKPNLSEAYAAAKLPASACLDEVANTLLEETKVDYLLITRSEAGISLFEPGGKRSDFPVQSKEVKDVTGAGDTVLATLSLALANGLDIASATHLSNIAAGISIERFGCVQVTLPEIARRILEYDARSKIFDETHLHALSHVLKDSKYTLLILNEGQEMTNAALRCIQQLSHNTHTQLLVYIQGENPSEEFIHLLSILNEVDFIVLQSKQLADFDPCAVFTMEKGELRSLDKEQGILQALLNRANASV